MPGKSQWRRKMDKEKWTEIARTGTFTDSVGRPQNFTAADLDAIVRAYDPDRRDAPLVFGHPKSDAAPAFGWVEKLKREGEKLFATFAHVPGEVKNLLAKKHYRHCSISLMPDRVTLRHVGLLGAAQPAIDGLRDVELNDGGDAITVDFAEAVTTEGENRMNPEELQRQLGQLQAQLEALKAENADLKKKLDEAKGAKDAADTAKTDAEKQAEAVNAEFSAFKGKIETERREARVSALVQAGKVKPAERADVLDFAAKLAAQSETVDFSAPDGNGGVKREAVTLEERYFRDLEARPVDERFTADFSAPPAHAVGQAPAYDPAEMAAKL